MVNWVYLPKIGDDGLAFSYSYINGWSVDKKVIKYMRKNEIKEAWFQCYDNTGWVWCHGIVNCLGVITQFG